MRIHFYHVMVLLVLLPASALGWYYGRWGWGPGWGFGFGWGPGWGYPWYSYGATQALINAELYNPQTAAIRAQSYLRFQEQKERTELERRLSRLYRRLEEANEELHNTQDPDKQQTITARIKDIKDQIEFTKKRINHLDDYV